MVKKLERPKDPLGCAADVVREATRAVQAKGQFTD